MIKLASSTIKTIRQGSDDFMLSDGMIQYPRAMVHILPECPWQVRDQINFAIAKGYLQCVAHVHDNQLVWEKLNEQ
jgi:hypothetical protein